MTQPDSHYKKGIILAGGAGTRLFPITRGISKQLLPVYDKPMIYYPLSVLMLAGIREILIISTPEHIGGFQRLFGDGSQLGLAIHYKIQGTPGGLPQAYTLGREFVGNDNVALILGDNIFYGQGFQKMLAAAANRSTGGTVFTYAVKDAERYGVIELDEKLRPVSLEEKPQKPKSNLAVTGLYFFDNDVLDIAENLQPSARGEIEIVDVIRQYITRGDLCVEQLSRGFAWLDTGTHDSLIQASNFIETIEKRQGLKIACLEEIAFDRGFINADQLVRLADAVPNDYGQYLRDCLKERM